MAPLQTKMLQAFTCFTPLNRGPQPTLLLVLIDPASGTCRFTSGGGSGRVALDSLSLSWDDGFASLHSLHVMWWQ